LLLIAIDQSLFRDSKTGDQNLRIQGRKGRRNVTDVGSWAIFKENAWTGKSRKKMISLMTFDKE
jgi:hypothetical protein